MSPGCIPYYPVTLLTHYTFKIALLNGNLGHKRGASPYQRVPTVRRGSGIRCLDGVRELAILEMKNYPQRWFPPFN